MKSAWIVSILLFGSSVWGSDLLLDPGTRENQGMAIEVLSTQIAHDFEMARKKGKKRPKKGFYYDWGTAQNGWGYCYKWARNGSVLNDGRPVDDFHCERVRPSRPRWGAAQNGWGYCYRYTPYGVAMNEGYPIDNYYCEQRRPSYYSWGTAQNGNT